MLIRKVAPLPLVSISPPPLRLHGRTFTYTQPQFSQTLVLPVQIRNMSSIFELPFNSRRSVIHNTEGMVACSQPLAARCGIKILHQGGNAADAAVAVAAGLNMSEPTSTGIGGDMFCLFYNAKTKKVEAMNGSGRSAMNSTLEKVRSDLGLAKGEAGKIPLTSVHCVTVPGAAAGWVDTVERFGSGKLTLEQILAPAIEMGEKGFPVSEISSAMWTIGAKRLQAASPNYKELLKEDPETGKFTAPYAGQLFKNPHLASVFRKLGKEGKKGFYTGPIAEEIVKVVKNLGGFLELDDLKNHMDVGTEPTEPISLVFKGQSQNKNEPVINGSSGQGANEEIDGVEIWEHPPNGQGIVALMALGIIEELENSGVIPKFGPEDHNSAEYLHALIEAIRIAFADASWFVTDPKDLPVPSAELISKHYLASRAKLFSPTRANPSLSHGSPAHSRSDTVYFAVTDSEGNGISFINSNFVGFGSGIIPKSCGFVLQNRGGNFSLQPGHPNALAPRKRPYHTIIPAMITNPSDQSLHSVYGVMGGFMQPQGHVQVLLNMIAFKMNPQAALDAPRFMVGSGGIPGDSHGSSLLLEEGITKEVCEKLRAMGHDAKIVTGFEREVFGRGQLIRCHKQEGRVVYSAGSDPRGDGGAYPA